MLVDVTPDQRTTIILDNTVELMFKIFLLRGECSETARAILTSQPLDEAALEDCARIDDTLATVYSSLQRAIRTVHKSRARRRKPTGK